MFAGVGFVATETEFETEQEAIREVDPRSSRVWKIKNPHSRNSVTGEPPILLLETCSVPEALVGHACRAVHSTAL